LLSSETPSLGVEFPSEEMELATQDVREMTEKEDDINLNFAKLNKKLQNVCVATADMSDVPAQTHVYNSMWLL
jgi:hypothetical protein